jgi:GxGYxYP putative glycoside hydrolase C-terminal domain
MLCFQDPRAPHVRDLAIAQKVFTAYGNDKSTRMEMAWLEPLSPILGWNCGDEFENTDLSTGYGDIQTASNWSLNLPVLMAGTEKHGLPKATSFDPRTIDWNDSRSAVCFIDTDGDNVQWLQGNFFGNKSYWGNSERGNIPFGWSCCFDHLAQLCPEAIEYALATRTTNDWFIEWGGGYYYPDRFGRERTNRWELLAEHARRTWELMKKTNTRIIGFNFTQFNSPDALKACQTFAQETDGLLAILVFQYSAYEAGAGKTYWVKDRNGFEVPVISARYCIWEHLNNRERAGTPAKVAREIRQTVENTEARQLPRYDWVIDHVWSYFKHAPGIDEDAENMPQEMAARAGGVRGYSAVTWCAERLPAGIRVVSPEELVWRIRMKHDPSQTKKLMCQIQ